MKTCPSCHNEKAIIHKTYGVLVGEKCKQRQKQLGRMNQPVEWTTQEIRDQRREFKRDTLQPWRDGVLSEEYVSEYGFKNIVVDDERDLKNMKKTWNDDEYYQS